MPNQPAVNSPLTIFNEMKVRETIKAIKGKFNIFSLQSSSD